MKDVLKSSIVFNPKLIPWINVRIEWKRLVSLSILIKIEFSSRIQHWEIEWENITLFPNVEKSFDYGFATSNIF